MTIGEYFKDLDIHGEWEKAVAKITMDHYPKIELRNYVWFPLLQLCADIIAEFASVPYGGPRTHVLIMETAMKRLKRRYVEKPTDLLPSYHPVSTREEIDPEYDGLEAAFKAKRGDVPPPWVPTIKQLRSLL